MDAATKPTHIIILGGGGDLARRKLFPALFELFIQRKLSPTFEITGFARTERSNTAYQELVALALKNANESFKENDIVEFCTHLTYMSGSFIEIQGYQNIENAIDQFEDKIGLCADKLFYLAVPPEHYKEIFTMLHKSKIAMPCDKHHTWTRILVEKPFGSDYITAQMLDRHLSTLFAEEQLFRIDHYLAKEAVQNILSFRFANTFFQSPWNKNNIQEVRINLHEKIDVGSRGAFYDSVGALRDVGQNHLLQILALIAMDEPETLSADFIRTKRALLLQKLIPMSTQSAHKNVIRAQYEGYAETVGVEAHSQTETYFEFKAYIDSDVWSGVPFFVSAGKALNEDKVSVEIIFHDVATGPFETKECATVGNRIVLTISPEHKMEITINTKKPGHGYSIESKTLSYTWNDTIDSQTNAYSKILLDCIRGDQTLFTKTEEVLASWKFITSIMDSYQSVPLQTYKKGSRGPMNSLIS